MVEEIKTILEKLQKMTVEELASYDVKLEDEVLKKYIKENAESLNWPQEPMCKLDPWQRMCYYQVSGSTGTDCDVALFTVVVYYLAYGLGEKGWKINKHRGGYHLENPLKNPEGGWTLRGDTMNSYATPVVGTRYEGDGLLRYFLIKKHKKDMKSEGILTQKERFVDRYDKFHPRKADKIVWSAYMLDKWEDFISLLEDVLVENKIPKEAVYEYIRLNHTIGNFIPVPFISGNEGEFNRPRGTGNSYDFWDLALLAFYKHYHPEIDDYSYMKEPLEWLLGNEQNADLCKNWLDSFDAKGNQTKWDTFVKQNFMQDFVNQEGSHYGKPKELWMGHFGGSVILGGDERCAQYTEFFTNASALIHARSIRIAMAVKNVLDGKNHEDLTALANKMVCG